MLPCPSCNRHVRRDETSCPFCKTLLCRGSKPWTPHPVVVIAMGGVLAACGPAVADAGDGIETSSASSDATSGGSTFDPTVGASVTTLATSVTTMTDSGGLDTSDTTGGGATLGSSTFEDDSADTCAGFYGGCPVDGGPSIYECDLFEQDCPMGEQCMPWANDGGNYWNASRCVPIDESPAQLGDPCVVEGQYASGLDSCDLGLMCFNIDLDTNEGTCVELCGGTAEDPTCSSGVACSSLYPDSPRLCLEPCDPLAPDCPPNSGCYFVDGRFSCAGTNAQQQPGEGCDDSYNCVGGAVCVEARVFGGDCSFTSCCVSYCDPDAPDCPPELECVLFEEAPDVGVCVVPE